MQSHRHRIEKSRHFLWIWVTFKVCGRLVRFLGSHLCVCTYRLTYSNNILHCDQTMWVGFFSGSFTPTAHKVGPEWRPKLYPNVYSHCLQRHQIRHDNTNPPMGDVYFRGEMPQFLDILHVCTHDTIERPNFAWWPN